MTPEPPALHGSRRVTALGWSAVIVAVILLAALTTALVVSYTAANGVAGAGATSTPGPSDEASEPSSGSGSASPTDITPSPPADAPAPAPENGALPADPAAPAAPAEKPPVALTESSTVVPQVIASLSALEAVDGVARGPGEVAGPALRFTLTIRNDTAASVSLAATVVNLYAGADEMPTIDLAEPGGVPLPDEVKPGQVATGTFVFAVPRELRKPVKISVDYSVGVPVVVFEGNAPV